VVHFNLFFFLKKKKLVALFTLKNMKEGLRWEGSTEEKMLFGWLVERGVELCV